MFQPKLYSTCYKRGANQQVNKTTFTPRAAINYFLQMRLKVYIVVRWVVDSTFERDKQLLTILSGKIDRALAALNAYLRISEKPRDNMRLRGVSCNYLRRINFA